MFQVRKILAVIAVIIGGSVLLLALLVVLPVRPIQLDYPKGEHLLIKNIAVVDVKNDTILPERNVWIVGNKIQSIDTNEIAVPNDTKILNGSGKFLMPALWDMHVHLMQLSPAIGYPQFMAHGVMHVRDMRGALNNRDVFASRKASLEKWNRQVQKGEWVGPLVHSYSTPALDGPHRMYRSLPDYFNCATPEDAIRLVKHVVEAGYNQIKIYNNLSRESFFALAKEAQAQGITIAGHKPYRVTAIEASNAGMKSLEHGKFLLWESTDRRDNIIRHENPERLDNTNFRRHLIDDHDTVLVKDIFKTMVNNGTYYCPTLLTRKADAFADDDQFRSRYDKINPIFRFLSFEDLDQTISEDTSKLGRKTYRDFYFKSREVTYQAYRNGVKILAGTDVPELPGSTLHEELQELSDSGIPAGEVLRTATLYPAQYFKLEHLHGSVEEGKLADLVILHANPLENISHTQQIQSLIVQGRYINEPQRKDLLEQSVKKSKSIQVTIKLIWGMLLFLTV
ncbi:amidohydrolase family protein [Algoriphagus sp. AK58]|uniref:amidohydrolase family protein n=1 Tax=Algoriphagus sp. AK58 TaxID=1406877 RepID=UPI0016503F6C|nr:amidohydrolase family protein [Algoriphagus sp. AK58]MBC6365838.1 hypothetical protein [Algoriphagus sp. AK58]